MQAPLGERGWGAFDELSDISENHPLILDVNLPDAYSKPLSETSRLLGQLLRNQQPVGGMSGQVNQTLVRQFRMPGYPFVLVTTDLLQEGEDLHTFCSSVHHYGISWTPSSMEQRIGRIDRVRSQTDRRLSNATGTPSGDTKLQVYYPHLEDTVEVLQVQRVLERMNVFLRLMHEGLRTGPHEGKTINTNDEFVRGLRTVPQIKERLESAFPVRGENLRGEKRNLAVPPDYARGIALRFMSLKEQQIPGLEVRWENPITDLALLGTAILDKRIQPFTLVLESLAGRPMVRCISPVGCVGPTEDQSRIVASAKRKQDRIGAILTKEDRTYDLTVEGAILLADDPRTDLARIGGLVGRVVWHHGRGTGQLRRATPERPAVQTPNCEGTVHRRLDNRRPGFLVRHRRWRAGSCGYRPPSRVPPNSAKASPPDTAPSEMPAGPASLPPLDPKGREYTYLIDVKNRSLVCITERNQSLRLTNYMGNRICRKLAGMGFVKELDIPCGRKGRAKKFLVLTDKGKDLVGPQHLGPGKGGFEHVYHQQRLQAHFAAQGYTAMSGWRIGEIKRLWEYLVIRRGINGHKGGVKGGVNGQAPPGLGSPAASERQWIRFGAGRDLP